MNLHDDLGKGVIPNGIVDFLSGNADASGLGAMVTQIEICTTNVRESLANVSAALGLKSEDGDFNVFESALADLAHFYHGKPPVAKRLIY